MNMAASGKKIGFYAAAGVAAAALIIVAIFVSGVQFPGGPSGGSTGTLRVSIMDAPVELANLNVTIDGLYVNSNDSNNWVELNFTDNVSEVYFNLLALQNVTKELSVAQISAGNYTKIRLEVKAANATFTDGSTADLRVPPGHIDVIVSFEIKAGQETSLLIDMQPDTVAVSTSHNLKPVLKATVEGP